MKRFGLSKKERLRNKRIFDALYSEGRILFTDDRKFKVLFLIEKRTSVPPVSMGIAVNKKSGTAVWRNRIKRLIRESYRLNKNTLTLKCTDNCINLNIVFSLNIFNQKIRKNPDLKEIMPAVVELLNKIDSII